METLVEIKKRLENDEIVELIFEGIHGQVRTATGKSVTERVILTKGKHINAPFVLGKEEEIFVVELIVVEPVPSDLWGVKPPTCSFRIDPLQYSEIPQMLPAYMRKELEEFEDERAKYAYALLLFLVTQKSGFRVPQRALRLLEEDNRLRAQHMNKELGVLELVDVARYKVSVYKVLEEGFSLQELQALVDVVLQIAGRECTDCIAVAGVEEVARGIKETLEDTKIAIITPRRIQSLLRVNRKSAWKLKKQVEALAEKKIIVKSSAPIQKGDLTITHFAITPLIEYPRSPFQVEWHGREGIVRVFKIDPSLQDEAWTWLPPDAFTRIAKSNIPNSAKPFVARVYLYLLDHRHDYTAYLSISKFADSFPSKWSKSRHKSELIRRIEEALESLKRERSILHFERKGEGWKVELPPPGVFF